VAVYVVAGVLAAAILLLAYRSLGGAASAPPDNLALLRRAAAGAAQAQRELDAGVPPRAARRTVDGCAQLLERVDEAALDDPQLAARRRLGEAVESLSWAARLREAAGTGDNPALAAAAQSLRDAARAALDDAAADLPSGLLEEADRPA
jgi:hypothetical protein